MREMGSHSFSLHMFWSDIANRRYQKRPERTDMSRYNASSSSDLMSYEQALGGKPVHKDNHDYKLKKLGIQCMSLA